MKINYEYQFLINLILKDKFENKKAQEKLLGLTQVNVPN